MFINMINVGAQALWQSTGTPVRQSPASGDDRPNGGHRIRIGSLAFTVYPGIADDAPVLYPSLPILG